MINYFSPYRIYHTRKDSDLHANKDLFTRAMTTGDLEIGDIMAKKAKSKKNTNIKDSTCKKCPKQLNTKVTAYHSEQNANNKQHIDNDNS